MTASDDEKALAAPTIGSFKMEVLYYDRASRGPEHVGYATFAVGALNNSRRLMEPRGSLARAEYEAQFYVTTSDFAE